MPRGNKALPPRETALLIIDMLNHFAVEGDKSYQIRFGEIARRIHLLKVSLSGKGVQTIFINTCYLSVEHYRSTPAALSDSPCIIRGSPSAEIVDDIRREKGDLVVEKIVPSGFFDTSLDDQLRRHQLRYLILTGVHTHVCVLLSAVDAFYRKHNVVVVDDCVTTINLERHEFGLHYVRRRLGEVHSYLEVDKMVH